MVRSQLLPEVFWIRPLARRQIASYDDAMHLIDEKFKQSPQRFFVQALLAFGAVALIAVYLGVLTDGALVAALGASAFIVFATPEHDTAQPRRLLGGHAICIALGLLFSLFFRYGVVPKTQVWIGALGAAAVGVAVLAMTMTDTEHPPAAGSALGFVVFQHGLSHVLFMAGAVLSLAIVHRVLRRWLRDLT